LIIGWITKDDLVVFLFFIDINHNRILAFDISLSTGYLNLNKKLEAIYN
jgi:hypothetical protein